jgi:DNA polymerase-3 subunit epsilon
MSVLDRSIVDTPLAVIDFETTGLSPKTGARVVEIGVVRVEQSGDAQVVLDTLVDPEGPVYATRIHGISDDDVMGAPLFSDLAGQVGAALQDAVVGAFNASFDMAFLEGELGRFPRGRAAWTPPHVCLMYLRPAIGLGGRCTLAEACSACGVSAPSHRAVDDALAAARLWRVYRDAATAAGARTFADLATGRYKFGKSLENAPFDAALVSKLGPATSPTALKPRRGVEPPATVKAARPPDSVPQRRRRYWHALVGALADGTITGEEIDALRLEQQRLELPADDLRAVHARLAGQMLELITEDDAVTPSEVTGLEDLFVALRHLGWAPGEAAE